MRFRAQPQIHAILFTILGDSKFTSWTLLGEIRQLHLQFGIDVCLVIMVWVFLQLSWQQCEICHAPVTLNPRRRTVCVQQPSLARHVLESRFWNQELSAESIRLTFVYSFSFYGLPGRTSLSRLVSNNYVLKT